MLGLLIFLAASEPVLPTTVNGQVLGTVEEFTTAGPARVCLSDLMVTALQDESVTLLYSGIHIGRLRLNRGRSWVDLGVGDGWIRTRQTGDVVERRADGYITDISDEVDLRYGLFQRHRDDGNYKLAVKIDGPRLSGNQSDRTILRRIEVRNEESPPCDVTYNYGWGVILGDEPLAVRPKK